jgi:type I restriction enzyme S subunit
MENNWPETTLGEVCDLVTGFPFKSAQYTDATSGIRLVRGDNVVQGSLRWDGVKRWPRDQIAGLQPYCLQVNDVVLAMDRPWIDAGLKYAALSKHDLPAMLVQRVSRLRGGPQLDTQFLKYLIGSKAFTNHVLAVQTGTAVPHISAGQIKSFSFRLPPISTQKRIANILGMLDDKIELNRRMNETLEAMARRLFKSWFIDFDPVHAKAALRREHPKLSNADLSRRALANMAPEIAELFPDSFVDSTLGQIPNGWKAGTVGDIGNNPRRGVQPSDIQAATPYIALEHMPRRCIALSEWGHADDVASGKFRFQKGEILFGKLRPYFHKVGVPAVDGVCSTDVLVITPREKNWFGVLLGFISSDEMIAHTDTSSTGTRMPRTNWDEIARFEIAIPTKQIAELASVQIARLVDRLHANIFDSRDLTQTRDKLLPRLLSGDRQIFTAGSIT